MYVRTFSLQFSMQISARRRNKMLKDERNIGSQCDRYFKDPKSSETSFEESLFPAYYRVSNKVRKAAAFLNNTGEISNSPPVFPWLSRFAHRFSSKISMAEALPHYYLPRAFLFFFYEVVFIIRILMRFVDKTRRRRKVC